MPTRTSTTHPIRVDFIPAEVTGLPGRIGMTFAPGKRGPGIACTWARDVDTDLLRLRDVYGAHILVSLIEDHELELLGIPQLFEQAKALGITVLRLPIVDAGTPTSMPAFTALVDDVLAAVRDGKTVIVHCRGGLGRTGLLAAACLVALGQTPATAIELVRRARPGAVETRGQERYVDEFALTVASRRN